MPESLTTNEYTDPQTHSNHRTQRTAEISLAFALAVAFVAAFPVNRYLISRGKGHAVVHKHHELSGVGQLPHTALVSMSALQPVSKQYAEMRGLQRNSLQSALAAATEKPDQDQEHAGA